jgi:hypothetical protein
MFGVSTVGAMAPSSGIDPEAGGIILDSAKAALQQEFQLAERYDAKSRSQVTIAGSWFAVVQAVVAVVVPSITFVPWRVSLFCMASVAGTAFLWSMYMHGRVWKLRPQPGISHGTLAGMTSSAKEMKLDKFQEHVIVLYQNLLGNARTQNNERAAALETATGYWMVAMIAIFGELLVALAARVSGG